MAGRGGRGGRSFGRGRGTTLAVARDDDGAVLIAEKPDGPPPLFPKVELPDLPDILEADEKLLSRRRMLMTAWRYSPYHIQKPKEKKVGVAAEIERYSDRYKPDLHSHRPPLASILKLTPAYFPSELLGPEKARQRAPAAGSASVWRAQGLSGANDLQRLEQLAKMEARGGDQDEKAGDKAKEEEKKQDGDEEDEEDLVEDEEELNEDDYAQNYGFDDDEDYLDDLDPGGDDEGPVF